MCAMCECKSLSFRGGQWSVTGGIYYTEVFFPGGVLAVYMTGGLTELHIANPKKYMNLKFYTQKNTWHQNFLPKKCKTIKVPQY